MGRIVRKVPADWQHPKDSKGRYVPLFDGARYVERSTRWDVENAKWAEGYKADWNNNGWLPLDGTENAGSFADWDGDRPDPKDYMPLWSDAERTHFMMYEDTTEGTPISPAFASEKELAFWLLHHTA